MKCGIGHSHPDDPSVIQHALLNFIENMTETPGRAKSSSSVLQGDWFDRSLVNVSA